MNSRKIHIVSFDVPYPADYGGVIDVYYRIKALNQLGFKIILHCFKSDRKEQRHLNSLTEEVYYYDRNKSIWNLLRKKPFIVVSRRSKLLLSRLLKDDSPILFEGIHSTFFLSHPSLENRFKYVRTHNVEYEYYTTLSKNSTILKSLFFKIEALKLKHYESILGKANLILSIKDSDIEYFKLFNANVQILPASIPEIKHLTYTETEPYALYTGDLSISENEKSVLWIIKKIWIKDNTLMPLIIAGKNPTDKLKKVANLYGVKLISNPSKESNEILLHNARVHILVSNNSVGIKLKLLMALQTSGYILVNNKMVVGTNLSDLCKICNSPDEFIYELKLIKSNLLKKTDYCTRLNFLSSNYSALINCEVFLRHII